MMEEPEFAYRDSLQLPLIRGSLLDDFLARGWYRMNTSIFTVSHLFLPEEGNFQPVHWLRFSVSGVGSRRSHKALFKKNRDLKVTLLDPFFPTEEMEELYAHYRDHLDFDGYDSLSQATFRPGESNPFDTKAWEIREDGKLVALGIFDAGRTSAASILHCYRPDKARRSLGRYLMLMTLEWCRQTGMEWYYPGYVVSGYPKMDYKLFIGKEAAQVYDPRADLSPGHWHPGKPPQHSTWVSFRDEILHPRSYTLDHWIRDFSFFFLPEA